MGSNDIMPFWHYNVPEDERTVECPEYLLNLSEKDMGIIATLDSDYHYQTWDEVCKLTKSNRLELFQRLPSELRRYRAFTWDLARTYGNVGNFILNHRLGWSSPVTPKGAAFQFEDDLKILYNDWPYGIDPKIVHLVVWTKFELKEDAVTGDLTNQARQELEDFVTKTFRSRVPAEHVSLVPTQTTSPP